jgi:hypothetical protein
MTLRHSHSTIHASRCFCLIPTQETNSTIAPPSYVTQHVHYIIGNSKFVELYRLYNVSCHHFRNTKTHNPLPHDSHRYAPSRTHTISTVLASTTKHQTTHASRRIVTLKQQFTSRYSSAPAAFPPAPPFALATSPNPIPSGCNRG